MCIKTKNGLSPEEERKIIKASIEAKKDKNVSRKLVGKAVTKHFKNYK